MMLCLGKKLLLSLSCACAQTHARTCACTHTHTHTQAAERERVGLIKKDDKIIRVCFGGGGGGGGGGIFCNVSCILHGACGMNRKVSLLISRKFKIVQKLFFPQHCWGAAVV